MLKPGDRFRFVPGGHVFEVLRVSPTGATVRRMDKKPVRFTTRRGENVNFPATRLDFLIAANAAVEMVRGT